MPTWSQKGSRNFPENPGNHPRSAQGQPRSPLGPPKDPQGTPQQPKGRPKTPKSHSKDPQMTPKRLQGTPFGSTKLQKATKKAFKTTPQRNQNSKWKIDATVIATATPPTQLSNNTASTMTSAQRNARSDPPPHQGRRARSNARAPWPLPSIFCQFDSYTPPLLKTPCGRSTAAPLCFWNSACCGKHSLP